MSFWRSWFGGARRAAPRQRKHSLAGTGNFDFEIRGEPLYQEALLQIVGLGAGDEVHHECIARLVLEIGNPLRDEVTVYIDQHLVGHLKREAARQYYSFLAEHRIQQPVSCKAVICGGSRGYPTSLRVRLDLEWPLRLAIKWPPRPQ